MILIVDNYDSFTYNLVQYFGELGAELSVFRNDELDLNRIGTELDVDKIVISPGPGTPEDAGISLDLIGEFAGRMPILGVCLGHQAIAQAFGGKIVRAPKPIHGKPSSVKHTGDGLFSGIPNPFEVGRYHSLIVDREAFPDELSVTAETDDGIMMGLKHRQLDIYGLQFHPESIMTPEGKNILQNFLSI
ncbi:MAG: aminodeoxychorismate/anthranilate synthase component II [Acidobacteriota bacterium]|nr:aminodeoxychorismate/anthranilate synthase component II [Acidobacteriota bacterium]MDH3531034.1 aminodeoxychorismate/anthranilate synthase component II [Acidobacteriota bacterium]